MNRVIKELHDIEAEAGKIMEDANLSRQVLQNWKKEQMDEISTGIEAELEGRMATLRTQLEEQANEDIRCLVEQNVQQIDRINETYEKGLSVYAQEMVKRITEV